MSARDDPRRGCEAWRALAAACTGPDAERPRDGAELAALIDEPGRSRADRTNGTDERDGKTDVTFPTEPCPPRTRTSSRTSASAPSKSASKSSSAASKRRREVHACRRAREGRSGAAATSPAPSPSPAGFLEIQAEQKLPDKNARIVAYCAGGTRSALAAATLQELGYTNVETANPGFVRWKDLNYPIEMPAQLTDAQRERYSRHILLPEVGEAGQARLLQSKVLLLGAGGLGSPAALYLAAAGVGTLGDRRRRRRRRVEPAAADHPRDEPRRHAQGRERREGHRRAEPRREGRPAQGAPQQRQRRAHLRGLRRRRRRHRQLPDALPRQRRERVPRQARRARQHLPLRRPGHDVHPREGREEARRAREPLLPLPLSGAAAAAPRAELPGSGRPRHPLRHHRDAAGHRGDQDPPRQGDDARRAAC